MKEAALRALAVVGQGEAIMFTGSAAQQWQSSVDAVTGLSPAVSRGDWYCAVSPDNTIQVGLMADPLCGDSIQGCVLVPAPWGANAKWTYDGTTFTPPPVTTPLPTQTLAERIAAASQD